MDLDNDKLPGARVTNEDIKDMTVSEVATNKKKELVGYIKYVHLSGDKECG